MTIITIIIVDARGKKSRSFLMIKADMFGAIQN